jgi:hypothetical protein
MAVRSEAEVDKMIEDMKTRTKGDYINQGVSFRKDCPRQMRLLKLALMNSSTFGGLIKELLALRFSSTPSDQTLTVSDSHIDDEFQEIRKEAMNSWLG